MIKFDSGDENWFRIGEKENIFDNLNKTLHFLKETKKDNSFWKWVIIAFHSAVYGSILIALQRSDLSGIWEREVRNPQSDLIDLSKSWLIGFKKSFEWIQNEQRMRQYVNSKVFKSFNHSLEKSIEDLNKEFRDQFLHYKPKGWSIEKEALREVIRNCLPLVEFLLFQSGNIRMEPEEENQSREVIEQIKDITS